MISGCHKPEMQRCVDENNHVVDDSFCSSLPATNPNQQSQNPGGGGYIPYRPLYHYYYGGWGGYTPGTLVGGGAISPQEGQGYVTSRGVRTGTVRGGFGRWFSFHGGGGGE